MNFLDKDFLDSHVKSILAFYEPNVVDENGGFNHNFYDDGTVFDSGNKQLVSSTRLVVNYALCGKRYGNEEWLAKAKHGLAFLEQTHWQPTSHAYLWTTTNYQADDMTQQAYGYAFVLLAYSALYRTGVIESQQVIHDTFTLLESRFWQSEHGLYADELSEDGVLSDYRGQNANMHLCEAMIAAYEATSEITFLDRALVIAKNITIRQSALSQDLIWEHFDTEFNIDWDYNRDDPKNLYRPWGFQPGHQTEWSKLLLQLYRHRPQDWMLERAQFLFDQAWEKAWDNEHGGLFYGFDPDGNICDDDKYFWVQAESFAAAAMLYDVTGLGKYKEQYDLLWQYSWAHFVDHEHGAWFRVLKADNSKYSNKKSEAGAKCDYHTICACLEVLRVIESS